MTALSAARASSVSSYWRNACWKDKVLPAGLDATGLLGIVIQLVCLVVAVLPAALGHANSSLNTAAATYLLACGLALSRFGLWTFDLAITQRLQADVAPDELGVAATCHNAACLKSLKMDPSASCPISSKILGTRSACIANPYTNCRCCRKFALP